jgi:hypothetical protein
MSLNAAERYEEALLCFFVAHPPRLGQQPGFSYTLRPVPDKRYWNVARIPSAARKLHSEDNSYPSESGYIYGLNISTN